MSKEKNTKNRTITSMSFESKKASFLAGIVVIITAIIDTIGLKMNVPLWIKIVELVFFLFLLYFVLGTKKLDHFLEKKGVESFGNFLTVGSVVLCIMRIISVDLVSPELSAGIRTEYFIIFSVLEIVVVAGAVYLLFYKYPKDK